MNFKNYGNEPPAEGGGAGGRMPGNIPLARQSSIYSLTIDEYQSTIGGIGKDFGSMNMDELVKNIWSAEETQTMGSSAGAGAQQGGNGYLQRQGSLTLPRTLSQKTVDEVWRDMAKEYGAGAGGKESKLNLPQRQQTLGEMTIEEFLVRAGVVKEDIQLPGKSNNSGFFGDLSRPSNNSALGFGFQQMAQSTAAIGSRIPETSNQAANLPLNVNGARSVQQQPQQIFPKQPTLANANPMPISSSTQLASPGIRGGIVGIADSSMNSNLVQNAGVPAAGMGMIGLGTGAIIVSTGSPAVSSDGLGKSNGDTSSVSPAPFVFKGDLRGRRSGNAVEKVIERRQRRMIKNRESAARSRARKQAYTMELEAEVAELKEQNQELRKKQEEMMEMQKNQVLEMMNMHQQGAKRPCLRRTQTGPW